MKSHCKPLHVAVLAGGDSPEREVSLRSGAAVGQALAEAGHRTTAIDPAGRQLADIDWSAVDVCFIALHGGAGEDGSVQRELERIGVPYTGSGPDACRLAMSKSASKERFAQHGVPTPPWATIDAHDALCDPQACVCALEYPLVIKPDSQGSSLGVSVVESPAEVSAAVEAASLYDGVVIAEPWIAGREFTVAVLGDRALPILEIVAAERFFSYEAKYKSGETQYRFDFELDTPTRVALLHASVAATRALSTRGLVRVDLLVGRDGRVWVLEVNAIPGMTARSLAPLAAQRAGLPMPALCDTLVRQCLTTVEVA
jgi:D-alanine-D-alanine ligase